MSKSPSDYAQDWRDKLAEGVELRPVCFDDLPSLLDIESQAFRVPWTLSEFEDHLWRRVDGSGQAASLCAVATMSVAAPSDAELMGGTVPRCVVGYVIYEPRPRCLMVQIHSLAVDEGCRRIGVGTALVSALGEAFESEGEWRGMLADVFEYNDGAQCFFRGLGFVAKEIIRSPFAGADGVSVEGDAYRMIHEFG